VFCRKQTIEILEVDGRCLLQSRITDDGFFKQKKMTIRHILRYTLERNRKVDLAEFTINPQNALIARIFHPLAHLSRYEFLYCVYCLAVEADRLEYVLSHEDNF